MGNDWTNQMFKLFDNKQIVSPLMFAKVTSSNPLGLEINSQNIKKYIFKTTAAEHLEIDDEVIVFRNNNDFYIIGKVIK